MKANPDKFQASAVFIKTQNKAPVSKIRNAEIASCEIVKFLGVDIDFNRIFDNHIKNICKRADQQLSVFKRLVRNLCKQQSDHFSYIYIIKLEFLPTV